MAPTVRFAPSPTGNIHIGNARTALFNWLFALKHNGRFIQRFDDTDRERSRQEYADATLYDLHWLGIFPDYVAYQSQRSDRYEEALEKLKAHGAVYACYETPEELERKRKQRMGRKQAPVYGREALSLTDEQKAAYEEEGRKPHWRFLLPNFATDPKKMRRSLVTWNDIIRDEENVDLSSVSDPVLVREDGTFLYTFTSVVDDIDMGVTHVFRGDDHVTNTGVQIALFLALDADPPQFGHHNLLTTASGEGLSKRTGALSLASLRESGIEPMAIASLAALTGTSEDVRPMHSMNELAEHFEPALASKSAAKFDPEDLVSLNRAILRDMPFRDAQDRLGALAISGEIAEPFWNAVRGNIDKLTDALGWWRIVRNGPNGDVELSPEDREFVRAAFESLPEEPWGKDTWKSWTSAVREATGRKGKNLFMPLRVALTGLQSGPELAELLPLFGREGTLARRP
jgi:glutamyl-tRNA synthetase